MKNNSQKIDLSIIILAFNKARELNLALSAFLIQNYDMNRVEIIMIDDGSSDHIEEIIGNYREKLLIKYKKLTHSGNRALCRNIGVELSSAERMLFLDGDMIPGPEFIKYHMLVTESDKLVVSMGERFRINDIDYYFINEKTVQENFKIIEELPADRDERLIAHTLLSEKSISSKQYFFLLYSNNFCIWKETYEKVNGFDAEFSKYWGVEDIELGYRLTRKNCRIVFDTRIKSYHINHPVNKIQKITELKKNLNVFLEKYRTWEIELFCYEHLIWSVAYIELLERINSKVHLLENAGDSEQILNQYKGSKILFAIHDKKLLSDDSIKALVSTEEENGFRGHYHNLLGSRLFIEDNTYDYALISKNLFKLDPVLFELIVKEAQRISGNVIYVGKDERFEHDLKKGSVLSNFSPNFMNNKKVIISCSAFDYFGYNKSNFFNLALALEDRGVDVALRFSGDPFLKIKRFIDFYSIEDQNLRERINQLFRKNLNFLDDRIPTVADAAWEWEAERALGHKYIWSEITKENGEVLFGNDTKLLNRQFNPSSANVAESHTLPLGINKERVMKLLEEKNKSADKFRFIWVENNHTLFSGLDIVVEAFRKAFAVNEDVELKIIAGNSNNYISDYDFPGEYYQNQNTVRYSDKLVHRYALIEENYSKSVMRIVEDDSRIEFCFENMGDNTVTEHISRADCLLNTNYYKRVSPVVLEAYALGLSILRPDNEAYCGYIPVEQTQKVGINKISGLEFGPFPESIERSFKSNDRYFLYYQTKSDSLSDKMTAIYHAGKTNSDLDSRIEFAEKFSWQQVAQKLEQILWR